MNILSVLSLILFSFYIFFGWRIYQMDRKSRINQIFIFYALSFAIWAITFAFFYSAPDKTTARFWYNLSAFGRFFYPALILDLTLVFTKNRIIYQRWWHSILLYILPLIFIIVIFTGPFITQDLVLINGQWFEILITDNIWWYAYTMYYMIFLLLAFLIFGWWGYTSTVLREKKQARIIIATGLITIILGLITNTFLPLFNIHIIPSVAHIIGVIFFSGVTYAIVKYKLLKFTTTTAADQIISKITDLVFLISTQGKIISTNARARRLLGYSRSEIEGPEWQFIIKDSKDQEIIGKYIDSGLIEDQDSYKNMEIKLYTKRGNYIPVNSFLSGVNDNFGLIGVLMVAQDLRQTKKLLHEIREKNIAQKAAKIHEEKLQKSLDEKDLLLKEIHHRVKNNMQIISSLLNLQAGYLKDEEAVNALKESQARIVSMAMLHENLYRSDNLTGINFENYIKHLIRNLFHTYNVNMEKIKFNIMAQGVFLNIDTAIPCGLIINELVTNSIKHAFPEGTSGDIKVIMDQDDDKYHLEISDNGIGLPPEFDIKKSSTLGILLVNSLVGQLDGSIEVIRNQGTTYQIIIKKLEYKERI
ncbi:MAG TPA: histidine kinase dimerization/phosphoacceptor domain -containing protein [Methanobacterium sp.]|mgnify:CR=1 FL=1|jgi:PAS domain S-box-containing protein|nr:MAG: PAS domain S-box protein [Methanobacterium sp.]HOI39845.1 histidine kinase dimerization/phosphoacceptor domain -containing protein [Methanobacterium sp.]HOI70987.1 histidine kinase dimerization/phosphoacceptor domain -containing protein [Methanobacterium sp.]